MMLVFALLFYQLDAKLWCWTQSLNLKKVDNENGGLNWQKSIIRGYVLSKNDVSLHYKFYIHGYTKKVFIKMYGAYGTTKAIKLDSTTTERVMKYLGEISEIEVEEKSCDFEYITVQQGYTNQIFYCQQEQILQRNNIIEYKVQLKSKHQTPMQIQISLEGLTGKSPKYIIQINKEQDNYFTFQGPDLQTIKSIKIDNVQKDFKRDLSDQELEVRIDHSDSIKLKDQVDILTSISISEITLDYLDNSQLFYSQQMYLEDTQVFLPKIIPKPLMIQAKESSAFQGGLLLKVVNTGVEGTIINIDSCRGFKLVIENQELVLKRNCDSYRYRTSYYLKQVVYFMYLQYFEGQFQLFVQDEKIIEDNVGFVIKGEVFLGDRFNGKIEVLQSFTTSMNIQEILEITENLKSDKGQTLHFTTDERICQGEIETGTIPGVYDSKENDQSEGLDETEIDKMDKQTKRKILITCDTTGEDPMFILQNHYTYIVDCPQHCVDAKGYVFGSMPYAEQSSICKAAIHSNYMSIKGGQAIFQLKEYNKSYSASLSHTIQSLFMDYSKRGIFFVYDDNPQERDEIIIDLKIKGQGNWELAFKGFVLNYDQSNVNLKRRSDAQGNTYDLDFVLQNKSEKLIKENKFIIVCKEKSIDVLFYKNNFKKQNHLFNVKIEGYDQDAEQQKFKGEAQVELIDIKDYPINKLYDYQVVSPIWDKCLVKATPIYKQTICTRYQKTFPCKTTRDYCHACCKLLLGEGEKIYNYKCYRECIQSNKH